MLAYGFNIDFIDEPELQVSRVDSGFQTIKVALAQKTIDLPYCSRRLFLSGREACYSTDKPFEHAGETGTLWGFSIKNVAQFSWQVGETAIYYTPDALLNAKLLNFWVLHTILPLTLTLNKTYQMLHMGAVEVQGQPVLFSAESFGGKSTLTDYFIHQGHAMYSDDSIGVFFHDKRFHAVAGYPFYRPYREPEQLGYRANNVANTAAPIAAIYVLKKSTPEVEIKISELRGINKYKILHLGNFMGLDFLKKEAFAVFSKMARSIPVYMITVPWDLNRLDEVYHAIVLHQKASKNEEKLC